MKKVIWVFLSAALLYAWAGCGTRDDQTSAGDFVSVAGPEWSLSRLDGSILSSEELKGKVVVVDFWATWCPPCRAEIPGYIEMQQELGDEGLVIVGVSLDEDGPVVVQQFAEQMGINYEIVMGDRAMVEAFGGVQVIPTTFLIDRDGQVRHRKEGAMAREDYGPFVRELL